MKFEDLFTPLPGVFSVDGENLKQARRNRGLTMVQLAKLAGVSQPFQSMIENGQRSVSSKNAKKIYKVLSDTPKLKGLDL